MALKDVREFMEMLDKTGDLVRIKREVDWDREAGAISKRACELSGPATLFEKVRDYPKGYRILGGALGTYRRVAIAMGLEPDASIKRVYEEYERREQGSGFSSIVTKKAPCKENIMLGPDVDLYHFPAPMCHEGDGGRYIATWSMTVSKDPETGWTNWGMYRFMIHNQRFLVGLPLPHSHLGTVLFEKYVPRNQPMPIAVVIGTDPLCSLAAATGVRYGEDEVILASKLRGESVELVKCETNDLLVPAHSEIVIEGEILPDRVAPEGPFGEFTGYRTQGARAAILCRVSAITYRKSPVLTMSALGTPPDDSSVAGAMGVAVALKMRLIRHKIPVIDTFLPPEGASHLVVVKVKEGGREVAQKVGETLVGRRTNLTKIIVVDEDVDIFNWGEVIHAVSSKCHSARGIHIIERQLSGSNIIPCYTDEERRKGMVAIAVLDATWPLDWPKEEIPIKASFEEMYSSETKEKVLKNWRSYGFRK
jgi:phenylphosphate carboxylase alpha subunit